MTSGLLLLPSSRRQWRTDLMCMDKLPTASLCNIVEHIDVRSSGTIWPDAPAFST